MRPNRIKELKESEAEEAIKRQARPMHGPVISGPLPEQVCRPNHNPVVSGLSPEDQALPPTEEYDTRELLTRLGQYGMSEFGKPFSLTELPSLPDNVFKK